jgi:tetratricopeptide (TPR) repeat protein
MTAVDRWLLRLAAGVVTVAGGLHIAELVQTRSARSVRVTRAEGLAKVAQASVTSQDWAQVAVLLSGAVEAYPESDRLRTQLAEARVALVLARRGSFEANENLQMEQTLLLSAPTALRAVALAKLALQRGQHALANQRIKTALELDPDLREAFLYEGMLRFSEGAFDTATVSLKKALTGETDTAMAHFMLGQVEVARRDWVAAARYLQTAAPELNTAQGWRILGAVLRELKQLPEAEQALRKALALVPGEPEASVQLGMLLTAAGRNKEAIAPLTAAWRGSRDQRAYAKLGRAYLDVGRHQEAAQVMAELAKLRPEDPEVVFVLGLAAEALQDKATARSAFEATVQRAGETERWRELSVAARARVNALRSVSIPLTQGPPKKTRADQ